MGILDWLFPPKRTSSSPTDMPTLATPENIANDRIVLNLVPRSFDPDGYDGDLRWYGCILQDQTGARYGYNDDNKLTDMGLHIFHVAGVTHYKKALQDSAFAPPNFVTLVKEDSNPYDSNAVAVWDSDQRMMVGYVPKEQTLAIRKTMSDFPRSRGLVLAHCLKKKRRVSLTILFGPLDGLP